MNNKQEPPITEETIVQHYLEQPCSMLMMAITDAEIRMGFACSQHGFN